MAISRYTVPDNNDARAELFETLNAAASTGAVRLQGSVTVQLSGTATDLVAVVEHATQDPSSASANWSPAEDAAISGDLSAGISPRRYIEPGVGWWRVRVATLTGGNCKVSIVGEQG